MAYTPGSHLIPLSQVPSHPSTKVRFLGCITHDPTAPAGLLTLTHPPCRTRIHVDISLVAGAHAAGSLQDGEWVNVMGYTPPPSEEQQQQKKKVVVVVSALLVWSAGSIRLGEYEKVVCSGAGAGAKMDG